MEPMQSKKKTYPLPPEVHAAVQTGRPALLEPLRSRLRNGDVPTPEEWMGVVDLCADVLLDVRHEREHAREERERLLADLRVRTLSPLDRIRERVAQALKVLEEEVPDVD